MNHRTIQTSAADHPRHHRAPLPGGKFVATHLYPKRRQSTNHSAKKADDKPATCRRSRNYVDCSTAADLAAVPEEARHSRSPPPALPTVIGSRLKGARNTSARATPPAGPQAALPGARVADEMQDYIRREAGVNPGDFPTRPDFSSVALVEYHGKKTGPQHSRNFDCSRKQKRRDFQLAGLVRSEMASSGSATRKNLSRWPPLKKRIILTSPGFFWPSRRFPLPCELRIELPATSRPPPLLSNYAARLK